MTEPVATGYAAALAELETILDEYVNPLSTAYLANKAELSLSQFNRQFKKRFHTTPRAYVVNVRLNAACHLLVATDLSMSNIAHRTGFYDQSHFTNQFVKAHGVPPSKYRALHTRHSALHVIPTEAAALRVTSKEVSIGSKIESATNTCAIEAAGR
jgi:transcriptional regulator GlxA family with amidase domain